MGNKADKALEAYLPFYSLYCNPTVLYYNPDILNGGGISPKGVKVIF
jgi:hypothetical protein